MEGPSRELEHGVTASSFAYPANSPIQTLEHSKNHYPDQEITRQYHATAAAQMIVESRSRTDAPFSNQVSPQHGHYENWQVPFHQQNFAVSSNAFPDGLVQSSGGYDANANEKHQVSASPAHLAHAMHSPHNAYNFHDRASAKAVPSLPDYSSRAPLELYSNFAHLPRPLTDANAYEMSISPSPVITPLDSGAYSLNSDAGLRLIGHENQRTPLMTLDKYAYGTVEQSPSSSDLSSTHQLKSPNKCSSLAGTPHRLSQLQNRAQLNDGDAPYSGKGAMVPIEQGARASLNSISYWQRESHSRPTSSESHSNFAAQTSQHPMKITDTNMGYRSANFGDIDSMARVSRRTPSIHGYPDRRLVESRSRAARFSHPSQAPMSESDRRRAQTPGDRVSRESFRPYNESSSSHFALPTGLFRRANPLGGTLSPLKALTIQLPETYRICDPSFQYQSSLNPRRVLTKPCKSTQNGGQDNVNNDYILFVNDILGEDFGHRYLVLDVLGQGTFGQVVKCQNTKTHELVAVKVIKNKPAYYRQSMMEATLLELLNNAHPESQDHILRLHDFFVHRNHLCLVFELLSINLYELLKQNCFRGLGTPLVNMFTRQILDCLCVLNQDKLIHCDLKPENVLLVSLESPQIKVIDFGSACHERQTVYTYIQSRFYRSPEVLLGMPYSGAIDMWSLGCIVAELFLGLPLFPGSSEYNQMSRIIEMLGMPPAHMIERGKNASAFFNSRVDSHGKRCYELKSIEQYGREKQTEEQPSKKYFSTSNLPELIRDYTMPKKNMTHEEFVVEMQTREALIDFLRGCLNLNPLERWSPQQTRMHPFVTGKPYDRPFLPEMFIVNMTQPHLRKGPSGYRSGETGLLYETSVFTQDPQTNVAASSTIYDAHSHLGQNHDPFAHLAQESAIGAANKPASLPQSSLGDLGAIPRQSVELVGGARPVQLPQKAYASGSRPRASTIGKVDRVPAQLKRMAANLRPDGVDQTGLSSHLYARDDPFHEFARRVTRDSADRDTTPNGPSEVPLLSQWSQVYNSSHHGQPSHSYAG